MSALAQAKEEEAEAIPGSLPLPDPLRERYCRFSALGYSNSEAGRLAGYAPGSGAHNKARKAKQVQVRIRYLAGDTLALLREQRALLSAKYLRLIHSEPPELTEEDGGDAEKPQIPLPGMIIDYEADGSIKNFRYDPKIALEAASQLRSMNGLDMPKKHADPDGRGAGTQAAEAAAEAALAVASMTDEQRARGVALLVQKIQARQKPEMG